MTHTPETFYYAPVDGCEECEMAIEMAGADAAACDECVAYGEAEKVIVKSAERGQQ